MAGSGDMSTSTSLFPVAPVGAASLRERLHVDGVVLAPGCFDGLSARVIEASGHEAAFVGGFSMAAARLGLPDVGLLSYGESVDQLRSVRAATSLPIIADADTGYGNPINAQRTLLTYAAAGAQCVMIEDQAWPKRCGHTAGKQIVDRHEAVSRIRAAAEARDIHGLDVLIMARTDANATDGFDEALWRVEAFAEAGADVTFLEAPESEEQMARYCAETPGWKTANLVDDGKTPWLEPAALTEMGYSVVLYPVALLLSAAHSMFARSDELRSGADSVAGRMTFDEVRAQVGWPDYEQIANRLA
ncbi:MAG: isocitrate lyase/PEP mutase family protein [Actinomycetota bacterium]